MAKPLPDLRLLLAGAPPVTLGTPTDPEDLVAAFAAHPRQEPPAPAG
ncbi:MAG: hypothetical protein ACRDZQ_03790 [Acidimicrobiales bacterium]